MSRLKLNHTKVKLTVWTQVLEQKKARIYRGIHIKNAAPTMKIGAAPEIIKENI